MTFAQIAFLVTTMQAAQNKTNAQLTSKAKENKMNQINYYDVIVNTARMLDKHRPTKPEVETLAKRMFKYTGKLFDDASFNKAFTEFRKADRKVYRAIYA